jgi:DNA-binding CsgD family transcriptional regulator
MLSEREQEIMRLIGSGRDTQEISILLRISPREIEALRTTLRRKLNAASAVDLVRFCVLGSSARGHAAVA